MIADFEKNVSAEPDEDLFYMMNEVGDKLKKYSGGDLILTDDKAPVELLGMKVIDEQISDELDYYKGMFSGMSLSEIIDYLR
jgi:hypothetical protein